MLDIDVVDVSDWPDDQKDALDMDVLDVSDWSNDQKEAFVRMLFPEKKIGPQQQAWELVTKLLRLHFLQGNSHLSSEAHVDLDALIDEQVVETLEKIRNTSKRKKTTSMVDKVDGRDIEQNCQCLREIIPAD